MVADSRPNFGGWSSTKGASTDRGGVAHDGAASTLVATDPPYGVQLDQTWRDCGHVQFSAQTTSPTARSGAESRLVGARGLAASLSK